MIIPATKDVNRAEIEMATNEVENSTARKIIAVTYQNIFELRLGGML